MALQLDQWFAERMEDLGPDGTLLYTAQQVQDFVALILLRGKTSPTDLPLGLQQILAAFGARAGQLKATEAERAKALAAYFEANPLPEGLVERFVVEFKRSPPVGGVSLRSFRG